jgi:hypothetical protein
MKMDLQTARIAVSQPLETWIKSRKELDYAPNEIGICLTTSPCDLANCQFRESKKTRESHLREYFASLRF